MVPQLATKSLFLLTFIDSLFEALLLMNCQLIVTLKACQFTVTVIQLSARRQVQNGWHLRTEITFMKQPEKKGHLAVVTG